MTFEHSPTEVHDLVKVDRDTYLAAVGLARAASKAAKEAGIGRDLVELVNVRVSQINGCARCLSVHVPKALKAGVSEPKLHLLSVWREVSVFTAGERAALEIAELTTRVPTGAGLLAVSAAERFGLFTPEQVVALEYVAITIGAFNRISIMSGHDALMSLFPHDEPSASTTADEETEK